MLRTRIIAISVIFGAAAGIFYGLAARNGLPGSSDVMTTTLHPIWSEVEWPFPIDEWGKGKAFRCRSSNCGTEVNVFVRAKIGFCNCTTGVADDQELERLSDFTLVGGKVTALGDGRPIEIGWMKGRSRTYAIFDSAGSEQSALSAAFNNECDVIVATAVLGQAQRAKLEPEVIGFLNGEVMLRWASFTLGM